MAAALAFAPILVVGGCCAGPSLTRIPVSSAAALDAVSALSAAHDRMLREIPPSSDPDADPPSPERRAAMRRELHLELSRLQSLPGAPVPLIDVLQAELAHADGDSGTARERLAAAMTAEPQWPVPALRLATVLRADPAAAVGQADAALAEAVSRQQRIRAVRQATQRGAACGGSVTRDTLAVLTEWSSTWSRWQPVASGSGPAGTRGDLLSPDRHVEMAMEFEQFQLVVRSAIEGADPESGSDDGPRARRVALELAEDFAARYPDFEPGRIELVRRRLEADHVEDAWNLAVDVFRRVGDAPLGRDDAFEVLLARVAVALGARRPLHASAVETAYSALDRLVARNPHHAELHLLKASFEADRARRLSGGSPDALEWKSAAAASLIAAARAGADPHRCQAIRQKMAAVR